MKKINLDQAEEIIRKKHGHTYAYHQINMYVMGYNDAVKAHNEKRKKKNNTKEVITGWSTTVYPGGTIKITDPNGNVIYQADYVGKPKEELKK